MTLTPDLVDAVDAGLPSLNTIELDGLRDAVRPILYAWASAVPVPPGTPGTGQAEDFLFVGETTRKGATVYDFLIQKTDAQGTYYAYASGQAVYDAEQNVIDRPTRRKRSPRHRTSLDATRERHSLLVLRNRRECHRRVSGGASRIAADFGESLRINCRSWQVSHTIFACSFAGSRHSI